MLIGLLVLGAGVAAAAAQSVPEPWGDITGRVRDRDGKPVAGASVRIDARAGGSTDAFAITAAACLRARPLPAVQSARDGTFVLPVLPEQRAISMIGLRWSLVVDKDGCETWWEHLPQGLYGVLDCDVVLRPADVRDEVEFVAEGVPAGAGVVVHDGLVTRFLPFDASGRIRTRLPRVPSPLQVPLGGLRVLRWQVQASAPGWTCATDLQRPRHLLTRHPLADASAAPIVRVDGKPARNVRALVLCAAESRWIDLPDARWFGGAPPLAFVADGCRMSKEPRLPPLPPQPPRTLRIVDPDGRPVTDARAVLVPAEQWWPRAAGSAPSGPPAGWSASVRPVWRQARRVDAEGRLDLGDDVPAARPAVLRIVAEAFTPADVFDPRGLAEGETIVLRRRPWARLEVRVHDADDQPIAGATVCVADESDAPGSWTGEQVLTDAEGIALLRGLLPDPCALFVLKRGYLGGVVSTYSAAGKTRRVDYVLAKGELRGFVARDARTRLPVPFADVGCLHVEDRLGQAPSGLAHGTGRVHADASGRLVLPATVTPRFHDRSGRTLTATSDGDAWGEVLVPSAELVWIVADAGTRLAQVSLERAIFGLEAAGDGVLASMLERGACTVRLAPAGTLSLSPRERAALPRDPALGIRRWQASLPALQLEFAEPCEQPEALWGIPADGPTLPFQIDAAVIFRDWLGQWRCAAPGAQRVVFLHPKYAPLVADLTDAQCAGKEPLRLALRPGSPVRVDPVGDSLIGTNLAIKIRGAALPGLTIEHRPERVMARNVESANSLRSPLVLPALAAGTWELSVTGQLLGATPAANREAAWTRTLHADGTQPIKVGEATK